ncbi:MAG: hypothetical protein ACFE8J_19605, partial [Candidatus Heimdallarchaeota archaeon]
IKTQKNEVLNGCLLSNNVNLIYNQKAYELNQFDFFFLPPNVNITLKVQSNNSRKCKVCLYSYIINNKVKIAFEIQRFNANKFIPRGKRSSERVMATLRTVWTAIRNGYFMSGFTNIPNESLKQGVITSVNLEDNEDGGIEIYSHIHPEYPEVYIMCIDDNYYAITQYLINSKGESVCKDLQDGEGLFFPGILGHSNFARPYYKQLNYCMYMWIIPTYGKSESVSPITLKV